MYGSGYVDRLGSTGKMSEASDPGADYSELVMQQILPIASIPSQSQGFETGSYDFRFSLANNTSAFLNRSYFKIKLKVEVQNDAKAEDGQPAPPPYRKPRQSDCLALAPFACDNLFSAVRLDMQGTKVSATPTYHPQSSALRRRLANNYGHNRTLAQVMLNSGSFAERQRKICSDEVLRPGMEDVEQVCLSPVPGTVPKCVIAVANGVATVTLSGGGNLSVATGVGAVAGDFLVINGKSYEIATVGANGDTAVLKGLYNAPDAVAVETPDCYLVRSSKSNLRYDESNNEFYCIWRPAIGAFYGEMGESPLPMGEYLLSMTPNNDYLANFVQSLKSGKVGGVGADANLYKAPLINWRLSIEDIKLYVCTFKKAVRSYSPKVVTEIETQMKLITTPSSTNVFNVPSATVAIVVYFQNQSVRDSKVPGTLFRSRNYGDELELKNLQITYAGQTKSPVKFDSDFVRSNDRLVNQLQQRYIESMSEIGQFDESATGAESFREWINNGAFYFASFVKGAGSATTANIVYELSDKFADSGVNSNLNMCVSSLYYSVVEPTLDASGTIKAVMTKVVSA